LFNDILNNYFQVTGEAEYADDIPMPWNGLHAALVLSKKPHARICFLDDSAAKAVPGFQGFFYNKRCAWW
jgi:xanthine dehydrogenase/oxidase